MDKQGLAEFFINSGAFTAKETTLKSGRRSPYFFNTAVFDNGEKSSRLGRFYAEAIIERFGRNGFDVIFGPAYKGIALAVLIATALYRDFGLTVSYSFNRKEFKDHGEKGSMLGHSIRSGERIILVDDVMTTGGTKLEAVDFLNSHAPGAEVIGLFIALDREEGDEKGNSALSAFTAATCIPVYSLLTIRELISLASAEKLSREMKNNISAYLKEYGVIHND
ncbi:MAG: orotate phosphoribosyltransferase [Candidatus Xenobiia bacterium LiM19]